MADPVSAIIKTGLSKNLPEDRRETKEMAKENTPENPLLLLTEEMGKIKSLVLEFGMNVEKLTAQIYKSTGGGISVPEAKQLFGEIVEVHVAKEGPLAEKLAVLEEENQKFMQEIASLRQQLAEKDDWRKKYESESKIRHDREEELEEANLQCVTFKSKYEELEKHFNDLKAENAEMKVFQAKLLEIPSSAEMKMAFNKGTEKGLKDLLEARQAATEEN